MLGTLQANCLSHGGDIGVTSVVGVGSTFWFTAMFEKQDISTILPQDAVAAHVSVEIPVPWKTVVLPQTTIVCKPKGEHHEVHILYAEDNVINQKVVLNLLGKLGYQADIVENGLAAVRTVPMAREPLPFHHRHHRGRQSCCWRTCQLYQSGQDWPG